MLIAVCGVRHFNSCNVCGVHSSMWQCARLCGSVQQCAAVCGSAAVRQCTAVRTDVCCSVRQCATVCDSVRQCAAVSGSVRLSSSAAVCSWAAVCISSNKFKIHSYKFV
jgi:hypothetical protein